ncbi:MAG: glycosyltransferase [Candidatus Omnitrophica bacterium]|nr:glycosyltransferase [Candidatus Omnitrophota bacterium]
MIYIVLPIYNEARNIRPLITQLRGLLAGRSYKIIAVNDGSRDESLSILQAMRAEDLHIESSLINMNVGAVFSRGIHYVLTDSRDDQDILIIMESDQTSEIQVINRLVDAVQSGGQDIVIASRYQEQGGYRRFPLLRRLFSSSANRMMGYYFPISGARDYTIFFRAYRVAVLKMAQTYFGPFGLIQSKGFVANAELLVKLSLFTDKIGEVPFVYDYGKKLGKSKIGILRTINEYFVAVAYLKKLLRRVQAFRRAAEQAEHI